MVFEKTLTDIVKGIRASKRDTALYISSCIKDIKREITSQDPHTKANALQKLTFLQMMGYDMSWGAFATIEVMSDTRFAYKRIGYLAASQSFTQNTDVILLCTNLLKKEMNNAVGPGTVGMYEAGLAINCLSNIVTEDLAKDLISDVTQLTSHSQSYLKKKAILCLFKIFCKYPQGLRLTFSRIQAALNDPNSAPSVTGCVVNVITELSYVNPKNYLVLAPAFFKLLTTSSNNWMLIKVVKLMGTLVPEEPRLARKLLEPLASIVRQTQAKSLLYEAVYTITLCFPYCRKSDGSMPPNAPEIVALCAQTLKDFVQESDQNLKYLGLVGFTSLMTSYPKVLSAPDYRPLILACLSDDDITIRTRALGLLAGMATRKNIMELVSQLMRHVNVLSTGPYKSELVTKIIELCSLEKYSLLTDFCWYIDILCTLAHTRGLDIKVADAIQSQLVDVLLRVLPARSYGVRKMIILLLSSHKDRFQPSKKDNEKETKTAINGQYTMPQVSVAASWIVGEYSSLISEAISMNNGGIEDLMQFNSFSKGAYHALIQSLLHPPNIDNKPHSTLSVYIQASMKVFTAASSTNINDVELEACIMTLAECLPVFMQCLDTEVQERACSAFHLLRTLHLLPSNSSKNDSSKTQQNKMPEQSQTRSTYGDLLNLSTSDTNQKDPIPDAMTSVHNSSIASNCRKQSNVLQSLYLQGPMKPVSAKLQRKKLNSMSPQFKEALDKPFRSDILKKLLLSDKSKDSQLIVSMDQVSFTQQRTLYSNLMVPPNQASSVNGSYDLFSGGDDNERKKYSHGFPQPSVDAFEKPTTSTQLREKDPFYLKTNVNERNDDDPKKAESAIGSRFGAIELFDSDNEGDKKISKRKKEKRKKEKKSKAMESIDIKLFQESKQPTQTEPAVTVYSSDSGDNDIEGSNPSASDYLKFSNHSKREGFEQLALVDLTTPLRDDEVMPRNDHRTTTNNMNSKKPEVTKTQKKKKKSKSKSSRKKHQPDEQKPSNETADLLGFGNVSDNFKMTNSNQQIEVSDEKTKPNLISSVFEDLLDPSISSNNTSVSLGNTIPVSSATKSERKGQLSDNLVWQKAVVKSPKMSDETVDLSDKVNLHYAAIKNPTKDVSIAIKIVNNSQTLTLDGVKFLWESMEKSGDLDFSNIGASQFVESQHRLGPFDLNKDGCLPEIRGKIKASGLVFPVKIHLQSTLAFSPCHGLKEDDIMEELSTGMNWLSTSMKLKIHGSIDNSTVLPLLQRFLNADKIACGNDDTSIILAFKAMSGAEFRTLVKLVKKKSLIKIDIKCTDANLSQLVVSDLKKLVL